MVFSELHWVPSALAAVLSISLVFVKDKKIHKTIGIAIAFSAVVGLVGYASDGGPSLTSFSIHTVHAWLGLTALIVSIYIVARSLLDSKKHLHHCRLGYLAAVLSFTSLLTGSLLLTGLVNAPIVHNTAQVPVSSILPEIEAVEFQNATLTPLSEQGNNAIAGTQYIDVDNYRLLLTGLVDNPLNLSYQDLLMLPAYAEVSYMPCVEGWGFYAKWTGFRIIDLLTEAKLKTNATYVVFHSSDGYSTGLPLDYLKNRNTLMAFGINDVTLPAQRGFPFQVVAVDKYGYKWAKWVTSIEVGDKETEGYWESRGYSNSADVGSFPFG